MTDPVTGLLDHARSKLRAARLLLEGGAWGDAASRAYYGAFHAVSAALLSLGQSYSSHAQVLGAFNREFVRTGKVPLDFTRVLTRLFEDRQTGDYEFVTGVSETEARRDLDDALLAPR